MHDLILPTMNVHKFNELVNVKSFSIDVLC